MHLKLTRKGRGTIVKQAKVCFFFFPFDTQGFFSTDIPCPSQPVQIFLTYTENN